MKKYWLIIICLFTALSVSANQDNGRYVTQGQVIYEDPQEHDVMLVKVALGRSTHLEFPEEPDLVEPGNAHILATKILNLHNAVSIWPLVDKGQTNLTVYTRSRRYNFEILIVDPEDFDRVIDLDEEYIRDLPEGVKDISVSRLLKIGRNYNVLKKAGAINKHNVFRKGIFKQYSDDKVKVDLIEAFTHKNPQYLIFHMVIHSKDDKLLKLSESATNIYVKGQKLNLKYIIFDNHALRKGEETDGWLILKDTYVSMDNDFSLGLGIWREEHVLN